MAPSIGRKVHYVLPTAAPRAGDHRSAEITGVVEGDFVNLTVFLDRSDDVDPRGNVNGFQPLHRAWMVKRDDTNKAPGTWHNPERVD